MVAPIDGVRALAPVWGEDAKIYQKLPAFVADSLPDAWGNQLFDLWRQKNHLAKNTDDHNKNFSFIMREDGSWRLSPAYDITYIIDSSGFLPNENHCMYIRAKLRNITRDDAIQFARDNGIRRPDAIIRDVVASSSYNTQLSKHCIVGAYTALELRGYSHYLSMGKPKAFLFTDKNNKLPTWLLKEEWDMTVRYMTTSFLGDDLLGVETMTIEQHELLVSSPERAILECLNLPDAASSLIDIYYVMEGLTTLRPKLLQALLESCTSQKVKRLFLFMAEKANHSWYRFLDLEKVNLGTSRLMVTPTGKYIKKYNMTISKELAEYE